MSGPTILVNSRNFYEEVAWKQTCMCPTCKTVWQHKDSMSWIREHFGINAGPITCPECGTVSIAQPKIGPRRIVREPQPEPVLTRTESDGFGRRHHAPAPDLTAAYARLEGALQDEERGR